MKHLFTFNRFINESSFEKDKKVNHIEDIELETDSDEELEKDIEDYIEEEGDYCPRCKEYIEDCSCETSDFWSTQTFHRVPKGEILKGKPKQNFKKEE